MSKEVGAGGRFDIFLDSGPLHCFQITLFSGILTFNMFIDIIFIKCVNRTF